MKLRPSIAIAIAAGLALVPVSCKTSYEGRYRFTPSPAEVVIQPDDVAQPVARALVSVRGVQDPDKRAGLPLSMGVRLRLENLADETIELALKKLLLFDADVVEFLPVLITNPPATEGALRVNPGETRTFDLLFPFPPGIRPYEMDLMGVHFRWELSWGERTATVGTTFSLIIPADPWPAYGYGYGVGFRAYCD